MPYTAKQLRWAYATDQPFADKWGKQVKQSGFEKSSKKSKSKPKGKPEKKSKKKKKSSPKNMPRPESPDHSGIGQMMNDLHDQMHSQGPGAGMLPQRMGPPMPGPFMGGGQSPMMGGPGARPRFKRPQ